ncbi:unnamed protein product [Cuscuta epithymum]|uniref:Uncharacterized protein n=1 Tax=Cuscuta epithymum TaxID=186058 RepID=A0AAV0F316_9ASTE|nr:unnamed protein product [Cuscuta epithymum]
MVLALAGLRPELLSIREQILSSSTIPTMTDAFSRILRAAPISAELGSIDSTILASQVVGPDGGNNKGYLRRSRPKCDYCHKIGHTKDRCWKLHGRPPSSATVAQILPSPIVLPPDEYAAYQKFKSANVPLSAPGTSTACVSNITCSWIIDSGASDHISGPSFGEDDWSRA